MLILNAIKISFIICYRIIFSNEFFANISHEFMYCINKPQLNVIEVQIRIIETSGKMQHVQLALIIVYHLKQSIIDILIILEKKISYYEFFKLLF